MELEELKRKSFVDFGNGFKFMIDDIQINKVECYGESVIFKVHPKSLQWVEIESKLKKI